MSNGKKGPGCLACIGDEILPFVVGFIMSHYRNPYFFTARIQWKVFLCFVAVAQVDSDDFQVRWIGFFQLSMTWWEAKIKSLSPGARFGELPPRVSRIATS